RPGDRVPRPVHLGSARHPQRDDGGRIDSRSGRISALSRPHRRRAPPAAGSGRHCRHPIPCRAVRLSRVSRTAWLLALVCAAPLDVVSAQALLVLLFGDKFASENVQGGIKFDVVWTTLSGLSDAERLRSWDLGGFIEVKLGGRWSIQPEFTFKSPAGARGLPFAPTGQPAID